MFLIINNNILKHSLSIDDSLLIWFRLYIFTRSLVDIVENCKLVNFAVG